MDDFALDYYDPRNAGFTPRRPFGFFTPPMQFAPQAPPAQAAPPVKLPFRTLPAQVQPMPYGYGYPPPGYPVPMQRRLLRDLTIGDLLPLLALGVTALRTLPDAPTDARDTDVNVLNQTKYMGAIARHFQGDARLNAIGTIAGRLVG